MPYHPTITQYTVLPPRMRLIYSEDHGKTPVQRYLEDLDRAIEPAPSTAAPGNDLVSLVFEQQTRTQQVASRQLAHLLTERTSLAQRHLEQICEWIEELSAHRPPRLTLAARQAPDKQQQELARQIQDLERQKREIELTLWRDNLELRRELITQRQAYHQTASRRTLLSGESHG